MKYTLENVKSIIGNKDIYIYGINLEGIGSNKLFTKYGYNVKGFIDSREFNNRKHGLPVIQPDDFFDKYDLDKVFILVATKHRQTKKNLLNKLDFLNFKKDKNYLIVTELSDYLPTIEVVGTCNLKCISCEMGVPGATQMGFMSPDNYRKILTKMTKEIPFMNSVCLYLWGEPYLHPQLPEILKISSDLGIATEISSNLNYNKYLEDIVKASSDVLVIPCSGIRENYEKTHTKGNWENFLKNLHSLREYIDKYKSELTVRIVYHVYKHNLDEDYSYVEALAKKLNFSFSPIIANVFPGKVYDYVIDKIPLPAQMIESSKMMITPIEEQLKKAYEKRHLPCPIMKGFPTIKSDGSVLQCCNMTRTVENYNYLDTSLDDLVKFRNESDICSKCIKQGIHRFFEVNGNIEEVNGKRVVKNI